MKSLIDEDILREILPRYEYGSEPYGGCLTLPEIREWVDASIHDHEFPETYTDEDAEGISRLLMQDVLDLLEEAEQAIKDCDEIEETNRAIHQKLCREGNSGGVHFV